MTEVLVISKLGFPQGCDACVMCNCLCWLLRKCLVHECYFFRGASLSDYLVYILRSLQIWLRLMLFAMLQKKTLPFTTSTRARNRRRNRTTIIAATSTKVAAPNIAIGARTSQTEARKVTGAGRNLRSTRSRTTRAGRDLTRRVAGIIVITITRSIRTTGSVRKRWVIQC